MALLGQDPVRCKIVVDNKCLQHVKNFKIWVMKFDMKMKIILNRK